MIMRKRGYFDQVCRMISRVAGHSSAFITCFGVIVVWGLLGRFFGWSDTWQLVINTSTSIVTFLMVFLIQNTQNRDSEALQLKIDELIRTTKDARKTFLNLEELTEEELDKIKTQFLELAQKEKPKGSKKN